MILSKQIAPDIVVGSIQKTAKNKGKCGEPLLRKGSVARLIRGDYKM